MINRHSKSISSSLSIVIVKQYAYDNNYLSCRLYQTLGFRRSTTKHRHERPHRPTRSLLRKPIPFVTDVKQVQSADAALSLFQDYLQLGFKHDYPSYSSLIYKLARSRHFDAVDTLLGYLQEYNIRCRETLFIALIRHYGKAQLPDKAIQLFRKIRSFNCDRTRQSFNSILNVLIENDRFDDANEIMKSSSKMGFRLNAVSFNIMIKGWLGKDDWDRARQVFDNMLEREVEPTVVTYNCQIGYLCRKGYLNKGKGLFNEMMQKGKHPNAVTFALLMEGLCSIGKFKEAKKMMFDMEYQGCKPQRVNYGVLMNDLGIRGKIDEAKSLLVEMKKRRLKPDVVMYNILVNYFCKQGRTTEAYKVLVEMQVQGCEPNAATYRTLVDGFCDFGDYDVCLKVLNAMLLSKHCPRLESFCKLIVGLVKIDKRDDASFVLEEMNKRNIGLGLPYWEALVRDFCSGCADSNRLLDELVSPPPHL